MPNSALGTGLQLTADGEHRSGGRLIARHVYTPPPKPMTCLRLSCYFAYVGRVVKYMLTNAYHTRRIRYAESHRDKLIPESYRTGDPVPKHLILALIKLRIRR